MSASLANIGRYKVRAQLGRGGMGVVYLAHDPPLARDVAIKVLPPELSADPGVRQRFTSEARSMAKLQHPNVLPVYDVGETAGAPYFVMKCVLGGDLNDYLAASGRLSVAQAEPILRQVAGAIDYAHAHGVVHRDLKPENILIDNDDLALLTDFGIARAADGGARGLTRTGMVLGTPDYMSPEQASGAAVDHRSDLYSFGVIAYRMLTGAVPFTADTPLAVAIMHVSQPPPDARAVRPELAAGAAASLRLMLAKDPNERYPSATSFVDALVAGTETRTPTTPAIATPFPQPVHSAPAAARSNLQPLALVVAALVLGGCLITAAALLGEGTKHVATNETSSPPVAPESPKPARAVEKIRVVDSDSSSYLVGRRSYPPYKAFDGQPNTAWNADNSKKGTDGSGDWIQAFFPGRYLVRKIRILTPYLSRVDGDGWNLFEANNGVKEAALWFDAQAERCHDLSFQHSPQWQELLIEPPQTAAKLRLVVKSAYIGTRYKDLAISELEFYGSPEHEHRAELRR